MRSCRDGIGVSGTAGTRAADFRSARADALRVLAGLEAIVVLGAINFSSFSAMIFLGADVSSFQGGKEISRRLQISSRISKQLQLL